MGELLAKAQGQLQSTVNERLDAVTQHLGTSMQTATKHTAENLQKLNERLAVIDSAQKNITDLASQVTSLRDVLSNKQTARRVRPGPHGSDHPGRAAEGRLRVPAHAQERQAAGLRGAAARPAAAGDRRQVSARGDHRVPRQPRPRTSASSPAQRVRQDVMKHVNDIAERYLCPGETQDMALMFVPSESVYAELHDGFDDVVQKAYRAQVMMVSPTLLMLAIQVIQQIQKDAQMREAADLIRTEVGHMMKDVRLLGERVRKLQTHFGQANEDIEQHPDLGRTDREARHAHRGAGIRRRGRRRQRHPGAGAQGRRPASFEFSPATTARQWHRA